MRIVTVITKLVLCSHSSIKTFISLDQKWDGFEMLNVSMEKVNLEFDKAVIHQRNGKFKSLYRSDEEDVRTFVKFEIDSIPEKRPFLLSKDFAYLRQSGTEDTPFKVYYTS